MPDKTVKGLHRLSTTACRNAINVGTPCILKSRKTRPAFNLLKYEKKQKKIL